MQIYIRQFLKSQARIQLKPSFDSISFQISFPRDCKLIYSIYILDQVFFVPKN